MIGDWMFSYGHSRQIEAIYDNERIQANCIELSEDEFDPIPLTQEILEKNGFESDTNMFGLCDYELSESYILENRGDRFCFVKRIPGHSSTFHIIDIKYVHELQHVLKFFEIEREIKL